MTARINAKDLQEYGLAIITASDPEFDNSAAPSLTGMSDEEIASIKPLSILIKNTSSKIVVGYTIVWECVDSVGQKNTFKFSRADSEAITDTEEYLKALPGTNLDKTIRPGAARLFSLLPSATRKGGGSASEAAQKDSASNDKSERVRRLSSELLTTYTAITVSIDAAFFDDGTFIGPDYTGLFDRIKAQVNAKLDLRRAISEKLKKGKSNREIFNDIEARAKTDIAVKRVSELFTPEDNYKFFSKLFANQFLQFRNMYGDKKAIDKALGPKDKPEPNLRKIK